MKIAYKELSDHKYTHVISGDCASFSESDRKVGQLIVNGYGDSFAPELWGFVSSDIESGVHKNLEANLYKNACPLTAAKNSPYNKH